MIRTLTVGLIIALAATGLGACSDSDAAAPDGEATRLVPAAAQRGFGHRSGDEALMLQMIRTQWVDLLNTGDLSIADEIYHEALLPHVPHYPEVADLASYEQVVVTETHALIADFHTTIEDLFAHGDRVVGRFTAGGLMGGVVPYTNTWIIVFRFEDGWIAEEWWQYDLLGVQEQLGAMPPTRSSYTWSESSGRTGDAGHPATNQALARRADQIWETGNTTQLEKVYSDAFVNHDPVLPPVTSRASLEAFIGVSRTAFPDFRIQIQDVIAAGDRVAVRRTVTATHEGPFAGIPATGKRVEWTGTTIYRIADGRIVEAWWSYDALALMLHLMGAV